MNSTRRSETGSDGLPKRLAEIAAWVGGEVVGDGDLLITGISGIKEAGEGDLSFIVDARYRPLLQESRAAAVIVPPSVTVEGRSAIRTDNPSLAFSRIAMRAYGAGGVRPEGIHPTAVIAEDAVLGKDVAVGPCAVIESGARIGDRTAVSSGCYIGRESVIGPDGLIYPHVVVRERVRIGARVIIHSGAVLGSDGFGFIDVEGAHEKIPQIGTVEIGDDVEIGANVTVDRARFDRTVIGRGTKIDNLVQIAHNVRIGEHCIIVSQVGISGSSVLEDRVVLAGQVGVAGHLTVGAGAVVASKSGVPSSLAGGRMYWGIPARPHMQAKRVSAAVQRLPAYVKTIQELQRRVEDLERRLAGKGGEEGAG